MRNRDLIEIKEVLARHGTMLTTVRDDINSIKQELIPEGHNRLGELEREVKTLNRYKSGFSAVIAFVLSVPIIRELVNILVR